MSDPKFEQSNILPETIPTDFHMIMNQIEEIKEDGEEIKIFLDSLDDTKKKKFFNEECLVRLVIVYLYNLSQNERIKIFESIKPEDLVHTMSAQILFQVEIKKFPFYTGKTILSEDRIQELENGFNKLINNETSLINHSTGDPKNE